MLSFNSKPKMICVIILMLAVLFVTVGPLVKKMTFNFASVILNKTLWQGEQTAAQRQQMLSWAATLLEIAHGEEVRPGDGTARQCSMIPAMVIADYHRKQRCFDEALSSLYRAVEADPFPAVQDALTLPGWVSVDQKGNLVLDWTGSWRFRSDSQIADLIPGEEGGWLTISYENTLGQREKVIYQWVGPLDIPYWHTLQVEARVHRGTFLIVETHSSFGVERHVNYYRGSGEWKQFTIPLNVDEIKWVYISLKEPSAESSTSSYRVDIKPFTLLLDKTVGTCE